MFRKGCANARKEATLTSRPLCRAAGRMAVLQRQELEEGIYKVWGRGKSIFSCNHVGGWWNNYTVSGLKVRLEIKICRCVYMYTRAHTAGLSIFKESDNRKEPIT